MSTAVDITAVARVVGIKTTYVDQRTSGVFNLPQRGAVIGQGNTASTYAITKFQATSANAVGAVVGYGCPLHLAALQIFPLNGDGAGTIPMTFYPLVDDGAGVASAGDITPSVTQTVAASYQVSVNNILSDPFVISVGDTVADVVTAMTAAINAVSEMPIIATDNTTDVTVASKWAGLSANDIVLSVNGSTTAGTTFAFTQPVGGLVNPEVDGALAQIGNVWETMVLNCLNISDTTALDTYSTFGEGRWGALVKKPLIVFTGNTATTVAAAIVVSDARKTDRVNAQLVAPGSADLPFVVAAREFTRIISRANNNPPFDYGALVADGLTPGADGDQWLYVDRNLAVTSGSSTIEVRDGQITLSDTVTFYHPSNDPQPSYRFVVDIVKLQNVIFNLGLKFESDEWNGAPLVPDDDVVDNEAAKKPKTARTDSATIIDALGRAAILSDPATTNVNTVATISGTNPKRLDMTIPVTISGNSNIIAINLNYGFFYGDV